ncbi:MAG: hypothetical protein LBT55_02465 [Clostridiaceae bacterium]|jgi:hypothetical protein|nr:hypothetical protein [Clostridiaceae bacterium]
MKKKLLLVVLMLAVTVVILTGCQNIIKKNPERVQNQVLATVSYNGESGKVTYGELLESFNSYGYIYVNYYGYTVDATLELLLTQLANRELLYLYAKDEIAKDKFGANVNGRDYSIEQLLTKAEIDKAVRKTNADLEAAIKSLAESLKTEDETNKGVTEETATPDGNTYTITFVRGLDEVWGEDPEPIKEKSGNTITLPDGTNYDPGKDLKFLNWTDGDTTYAAGESVAVKNGDMEFTAEWGPKVPDARPVREEAEKVEDAEETDPEDEGYDPDKNDVEIRAKMIVYTNGKDVFNRQNYVNEELMSDEYFEKALAKLLKNLEASYKTYDYYYQVQLKTIVMERFEKKLKGSVTVTDEALTAEYNRIIAANKESFAKSSTAYAEAVASSLTGTIYHAQPNDYGYVYNILLKFDDDEFAEINRVYTNNTGDPAAFKAYVEEVARAKTVWISNYKYTTAAGTDDEEKAKHIIGEDGSCAICGEDALGEDKYNNLVTINLDEKTVTVNAYRCATEAYLPDKWPAYDVFESGVLVKKGIVTQVQESLKVVADSNLSALDKAMLSQEVAKTWIYLVGDDNGMYANTDSYNPLGYVVTLSGDSSYIKEFTDRARELFATGGLDAYSDLKTLGTQNGSGNEVIASAMSSGYAGIFIIVPGYVPFNEETIQEATTAEGYEGEDAAYYIGEQLLPLDYTIIYGKDKKLETTTVRKTLEETLRTGLEADAYNNMLSAFLAEHPNAVNKDAKIYKSLLKDLGLS